MPQDQPQLPLNTVVFSGTDSGIWSGEAGPHNWKENNEGDPMSNLYIFPIFSAKNEWFQKMKSKILGSIFSRSQSPEARFGSSTGSSGHYVLGKYLCALRQKLTFSGFGGNLFCRSYSHEINCVQHTAKQIEKLTCLRN